MLERLGVLQRPGELRLVLRAFGSHRRERIPERLLRLRGRLLPLGAHGLLQLLRKRRAQRADERRLLLDRPLHPAHALVARGGQLRVERALLCERRLERLGRPALAQQLIRQLAPR